MAALRKLGTWQKGINELRSKLPIDGAYLCRGHGHDTNDGTTPRGSPLVRILVVYFAVNHVLNGNEY